MYLQPGLPTAFAAATIASTVEATSSPMSLSVAKSVFTDLDGFHEKRESMHRILAMIEGDVEGEPALPAFMNRRLDDNLCDARFISCLDNDKCRGCFDSLAIGDVDWTGLAPGTECTEVIGFLSKAGHCADLVDDVLASRTFCNTFESCVVWTDDDEYFTDDDKLIDCFALTECYWEGMDANWIGDGICHENINGCYNTAICGYDGGDCCQDTCEEDLFATYVHCGIDGYACKDPGSDYCNSSLTKLCPSTANGGKVVPDPSETKCKENESKYRLVLYDSFGDGWDSTTLTIVAEDDKTDLVYSGGLSDGFQMTEYICLSKDPKCYNAKTQGGTWGVEVSWEVKPMADGSPSIAGGGAPGDCDFGVGGDVCLHSCTDTKPNIDPSRDPDYKEFKDLYQCIEDKCIIQLGACQANEECNKCFGPDAPGFCYGLDEFIAVIDCTMCSCTDRSMSDFCSTKTGPGQVTPPTPPDDKNVVKECTPKETMDGTAAIMDYSECANLDSVSLLITDFDQNNFGQLDAFETCAKSFRDEENHGGRTALSCMKILKNAIINPTTDSGKKAPREAIAALASNLYDHGQEFCDCTKKASDKCPLCPSFMNFKTILYESIDACHSLDAIDCDSWGEFWRPCQNNLIGLHGSVDFGNKEQCGYVKAGCGDAGPFPAFRRLDCEDEVSEEAWDFYKNFAKGCLKGKDGVAPTLPPSPKPPTRKPTPQKKPTPKPSPKPYIPSTDKPTSKPYIPSDNKPSPKPYVPSDNAPTAKPYVPSGSKPTPKPYIPSDATNPSSDEETKKSKSHWFRNLVVFGVLVGGGYYLWKKRYDGFNFMQYRRRFGGGFQYGMVNSGIGENDMYGNLNSSTSFEPPTLPPAPHMMTNSNMMNPNNMMNQNPNPNMMMSGP